MSDVKSIVLIGVGGQGTILVSKILTHALMEHGYDVKMSEVRGMAQRGGSVSTQVRFGKKVHSPLIGEGTADVLVAFEKMEAARGLPQLKEDGILIANDYEIVPLPVAAGRLEYPDQILEALNEKVKVISFDAAGTAEALGQVRAMNVVLLGALVEALNLTELDVRKSVAELVPPAYRDVNLKAFDAGRQLAKEHLHA